ncbi:MAG: cysteine synthase A [Clostridia bacterium]|nr:cysteine synthase A [Clostridia bacterium]MCI2000005.1 cysteine synthase A [Clostridia bacterium]MCI2014461.1 cysteine synthase A [Clostridia bacterium]
MKIYSDITQTIGNTPLVEIQNIEKEEKLEAKVLCKLEFLNPAGSAKDRVAKSMIEDAEKRGVVKAGAVIIEPTSGNTGIGLAAICASKGYKSIFVMPDTMSVERQNLLKAYGAKIVLTPGKDGMKGSIEKAEELAKSTPGSFIPGQFDNPANPAAHEATTGPEIWNDTDGTADIFVAGVGTGGTLSGTGRYLRKMNPKVKIVAVEPASSPMISKGYAGAHKLQGIGANFIPKNYDGKIVDEVIAVKDEDAYETGRRLARKEGILAGISAGAAVWAAIELAKRAENKGKNIIALVPDTGDRYLSTPDYLV